ncbi:hypothetical protein [Nannocystis punicea]|uniref:Uncharacterized protein n=1 Tax=Nannocystis punicea TaxID=2995304 RepID=A0ABY7H2W4_9BACT|nr:hypothetical protein [Nannocystis poenicansa]WAS93616.1 hypothetical protein O0S08_46385 [Nannocystis poenicansa]
MRLRSLLLSSSIGLGACSTAAPQSSETLGNSTASASNTDGPSDTAGQSTAGSTESTLEPTGDPGTTAAATTALTATGTTGDGETSPTSTAAPSTTDVATTGETTSATTGDTTEADTTAGTDTDTTTGGMGGGPCEVDADCKLHDDCCSCYGIPNDQTDPICKAECEQTQCEQIGIDEAKCVLGQCTTEKVDCSSEVACDSLPPDCPPGTLPGIADACWSGACVPAVSCDKVPDCESCPDSYMCVAYLNVLKNDLICLPLPVACDGQASCDCAGEACTGSFDLCTGSGDADLACDCPNC